MVNIVNPSRFETGGGSPPGGSLLDNLISYWKLDEASGTRFDIHGTSDFVETSAVSSATGKINDGARFTPSNGTFTMNNPTVYGTSALSFSCWVRNTGGGGFLSISSISQTGRVYDWSVEGGNADLIGRFNSGNVTYGSIPNDGLFYHVVVTRPANATVDDLKAYINGVLQTPTTGSGSLVLNNDGNIDTLGESVFRGEFDGVVDELAIAQTEWTQEQVNELYNSGAGLPYSSFSSGPPSSSNGLLNGLLSYWQLDETSGTRVDSRGSNDFLETGSVTSAAGIINNASSFPGTNGNNLDATSSVDLGTSAVTLSFWFKTTSTSEVALFAASGSTTGGGSNYRWFVDNGGIRGRFGQGSAVWGSGYNDGNFHHLVISKDLNDAAEDLLIMVDGNIITTSVSRSLDLSPGNFSLGKKITDGSNFNGEIDEVGYWSRALTQAEILDLYNSGSGLPYSSFDS